MNNEYALLLLGVIITVFGVLIFIIRKTHIETMSNNDESECEFVSSRGLLKSCTFHSADPKSSNSSDTRYLQDMLEGNMFDGMSIYVCSDMLAYFVSDILPKLKNKFVLVSGDSDLTIPDEALNKKEDLLNHPLLIRWFAQNCNKPSGKLVQIPIGLDYHTISNNPSHKWMTPGEDSTPLGQEAILKGIDTTRERIPKIYVNFSSENDRFGQRKESLNRVPKSLIEYNNTFIPRTENWKLMSQYAFVLSPFGIGMDCHRTWEALCLGCIPIVCMPEFKPMFEGLPVLNVNRWEDINETLLMATIKKFKNSSLEKLQLKYWTRMIHSNI